jgi:hypothetical protein
MSNGDIIAVIAVVIALLAHWAGLERRLTRIETKLDVLWDRLPCLQKLGKTLATSDSCNPS